MQSSKDRAFWHAINLAASRTKGLPSWTSGGINVSNNFEGPKKDDRLMAPFRVDISRVRTKISKERNSEFWCATVCLTNMNHFVGHDTSPTGAMRRALHSACVEWAPFLQPHPWKRADGSHIKAEWEE